MATSPFKLRSGKIRLDVCSTPSPVNETIFTNEDDDLESHYSSIHDDLNETNNQLQHENKKLRSQLSTLIEDSNKTIEELQCEIENKTKCYDDKIKKLIFDNTKIKNELFNAREQHKNEIRELTQQFENSISIRPNSAFSSVNDDGLDENQRWFDDKDLNMYFSNFQKSFDLKSKSIFLIDPIISQILLHDYENCVRYLQALAISNFNYIFIPIN